jgi:hypothetical protein
MTRLLGVFQRTDESPEACLVYGSLSLELTRLKWEPLFRLSSHRGLQVVNESPDEPLLMGALQDPECSVSLSPPSRLSISPQLTLHRGSEACLVQLRLQRGTGDQEPDFPPELWFEEKYAPKDILKYFVEALQPLNKTLVESSSSKNVYELAELLSSTASSSSSTTDPHKPLKKWPENLPAPGPDSALYKAGSLGVNLLSSVLGRPLTEKIEDVGWNVLEGFSKVTQIAKDQTSMTTYALIISFWKL